MYIIFRLSEVEQLSVSNSDTSHPSLQMKKSLNNCLCIIRMDECIPNGNSPTVMEWASSGKLSKLIQFNWWSWRYHKGSPSCSLRRSPLWENILCVTRGTNPELPRSSVWEALPTKIWNSLWSIHFPVCSPFETREHPSGVACVLNVLNVRPSVCPPSPRVPRGRGSCPPSEGTPGGCTWRQPCLPSWSPSCSSWTSRSPLSSSTGRSTSSRWAFSIDATQT